MACTVREVDESAYDPDLLERQLGLALIHEARGDAGALLAHVLGFLARRTNFFARGDAEVGAPVLWGARHKSEASAACRARRGLARVAERPAAAAPRSSVRPAPQLARPRPRHRLLSSPRPFLRLGAAAGGVPFRGRQREQQRSPRPGRSRYRGRGPERGCRRHHAAGVGRHFLRLAGRAVCTGYRLRQWWWRCAANRTPSAKPASRLIAPPGPAPCLSRAPRRQPARRRLLRPKRPLLRCRLRRQPRRPPRRQRRATRAPVTVARRRHRRLIWRRPLGSSPTSPRASVSHGRQGAMRCTAPHHLPLIRMQRPVVAAGAATYRGTRRPQHPPGHCPPPTPRLPQSPTLGVAQTWGATAGHRRWARSPCACRCRPAPRAARWMWTSARRGCAWASRASRPSST